jgi:Zn-dependent protease with chaperone function
VIGIALPLATIVVVIGLCVLLMAVTHLTGLFGKLMWLTALPLIGAVRALFEPVQAPPGVPVDEATSPELFAAIDRARARHGIAALTGVVIDSDYNCGVIVTRSFGTFGARRVYLILGLPLLSALDRVQFDAVLAHEFGHVARRDHPFEASVYATRLVFISLLERIHQHPNLVFRLIAPLFERFVPYYLAATLAIGRRVERDADAAAAEVAGPHLFAEALCAMGVRGAWLDEAYWPSVLALAQENPEPPIWVMVALRDVLALPNSSEATMLESQLAQTVDALDTHPPLAERLANLGLTEHDALSKSIGALAPEASAATLIGEALPSTARSVGVDWAVAIEAWWRAVYAHARTMAVASV